MRTFVIIPDGHDGGAAYEMIVNAESPELACQHTAKHLHCDDEIERFEFAVDGTPTSDVWMAREIPSEQPEGVIDWKKFSTSFWRARRH